MHPFTTLAFFGGGTTESGKPLALINSIADSKFDLLNRPEELVATVEQLGPVWATIFIMLGTACVLNGFRWHKMVIFVLALLGGAGAGAYLGERVGVSPVVTAAATGLLAAVLAWPVMRYTVALFAGIAGACAGANIWSAVGEAPERNYVGEIIGLVVLGMLAFIAFRLVIIAFTSIGGASLVVFGVLALLLNMESLREGIVDSLDRSPLVVPIITGATALVGMVFQQGGGVSGLLASADRAGTATTKAKPNPATA